MVRSDPDNRLKIAIVRQRYNPFGGAERFVERALAALAAEGAEVTLVARAWDSAPNEGYRRLICDPPYSRLIGGRLARDRSFASAAAKVMAEGGFDITQSHERIPGCMIYRAGDGVHAAWLRHRGRSLNAAGRAVLRLSPYHRYVLATERAMFSHAKLQAVICNSRMVAREIREHYDIDPARLHVIYNGVDTEVFHPALAKTYREPVRAELGIPLDVPLLLFVGSGYERKGVPRLMQAFARMQGQAAHLVVVGADRRLRAMQRVAARSKQQGRIHFLGPQTDVRPYYAAADAFVLPTLYDPGPNAALEALACGLPVLTTTTCGAAELVHAGKNGWVVDALDVAEMAARLDDLCDLAGRAEARLAARESVAQLSLTAMAALLLKLYQHVSTNAGQ